MKRNEYMETEKEKDPRSTPKFPPSFHARALNFTIPRSFLDFTIGLRKCLGPRALSAGATKVEHENGKRDTVSHFGGSESRTKGLWYTDDLGGFVALLVWHSPRFWQHDMNMRAEGKKAHGTNPLLDCLNYFPRPFSRFGLPWLFMLDASRSCCVGHNHRSKMSNMRQYRKAFEMAWWKEISKAKLCSLTIHIWLFYLHQWTPKLYFLYISFSFFTRK